MRTPAISCRRRRPGPRRRFHRRLIEQDHAAAATRAHRLSMKTIRHHHFFRPLSPGAVPPPRSGNATRWLPRGGPMQPDRDGDGLDLSKLNIIVDEPGRAGVSQPQERLPLPAGPTVSPNLSPKPVDRTAAVPPKPEP